VVDGQFRLEFFFLVVFGLFTCLFTVLRPFQEFFTNGDITIAGEGAANLRPMVGAQGL
jgi:hypothetical protein